jgi:hypothetical protein
MTHGQNNDNKLIEAVTNGRVQQADQANRVITAILPGRQKLIACSLPIAGY